ncbi:Protein of unknown function DUF2829 [uncultured Caudovirales phage]|uniref:Thoeris anti-defense 2-like domain-containing protein n=1 Tax=uncultured Caudovirales phage TaxID=2100421 RepID=A0A6J7W2Y3_9CAUD|nr:Protein of unknown function DUF2829 [uncultured Caudovirales phage]
MKRYIGTKLIDAQPMTRSAYNEYRGWALPANEDGADDGYLVEYTDGGKPNDSRHAGYISWSPKEQFDNAYRETDGLTFGWAVEALKKGHRVAREGWNGKGMFVALVNGCRYQPDPDSDTVIIFRPHCELKNVDGSISTWAPSIGDALAEDWGLAA